MSYKHGVFIEEVPTSLTTPVNVSSAMPVIIGTAPVHNLADEVIKPINIPRLIHSMPDFIANFGMLKESDNKADFTLYQAAEIYLTRYKLAPLVAINVFNPEIHKDEESNPDVSKVTKTDIIGEANNTGRTGLQLVDEVYPRFALVPAQVLAPKYSADPTVAIAIGAMCNNISGHFKAMGICDVPDTVTHYTEIPKWLTDNNIKNANLLCMYGNAVYGGIHEAGSIHLASVIAKRDAENSNIPFWSPSNYPMLCEGMTHNGKELHLTSTEAAYLNGQGIVTALNMIGGLRIWGDQTSIYPSSTDVKDSSIPIRRMFSFVGNTLVLTAWQYVSSPIRRRLIETVQDTFTVWLNGLTAREFILGGRVEFEQVDNPTIDLLDGKVRFHVYLTPPQAAREITFMIEYDPEYLQTLFNITV